MGLDLSRSALTICVLSALDDLDSMLRRRPIGISEFHLSLLTYKLKNLRMFVLSTRTALDIYGNLRYSLDKINAAVRRIAEEIRRDELHDAYKRRLVSWDRLYVYETRYESSWDDLSYEYETRLVSLDGLSDEYETGHDFFLGDLSTKIQKCIQPSLEEIDRYLARVDEKMPRFTSFRTNEVLEIITTCLESLEGFLTFQTRTHIPILAGMEALKVKMTFLKSLICFIRHRSTQPTNEFWSHAEAVAIRAAYLLFTCRYDYDFSKKNPVPIKIKISTFVQKMKLIEDVHESYTQVLRKSKFSKPSSIALPNHHQRFMNDLDSSYPRIILPNHHQRYRGDFDSSVAMMNILYYLIYTLWKLLVPDTCHVVDAKDQLLDLFHGLRSLRKILKQQPSLSGKEEIVAVVCDVIVIFSDYQSPTKLDLGLQDVLQTIARIVAKLGENPPQLPSFNFPMVNQLGFVDFVLEKLSELITSDNIVKPTFKSLFQAIQNKFASLSSFLGEIQEFRDSQQELQALWNRIIKVACKVEDLIDHAIVGDFPDAFLISSFNLIMKDIQGINTNIVNTHHGKGKRSVEVKEVTETCYQVSSQRSALIINEIVGFVDEEHLLMNRLTRGSKKLQIIGIVGMPGLGKTTLAIKVYSNPFVARHFPVRVWSSISQVLDKKRVLLELLNQIEPNGNHSRMNESDLADKVRRKLKQRKYLIILDDIWHVDAWYQLGGSFPDDKVGSRIILTSRHRDAAPLHMLDQEPLILSPLNDEDSLKLIKSRLFPENGWTLALLDLLRQIVERCKGLPLSIVIVAGILANTDTFGWKNVLDGLANTVSSIEQCSNSLALSYRYLPDHLKSCLLYFGVFQEDEEISTRKLLSLWIAEGFVRKAEMRRDLDVAEEYLNELINRSLVMVSKQRWDRRVKSCRVHDLLHEFCLRKAKDEDFLHIIKGNDELEAFNESLRRICIYSKTKKLKKSWLFCPARSLLLNKQIYCLWEDISFLIHRFKLLRVLDLEQISVRHEFPRELEMLVLLSFLAIRGYMEEIPTSIDKLWNLETFIVTQGHQPLLFPSSVWNLGKLKRIHIKGFGVHLPVETLDNSSVLYELDSFSGAVLPSGTDLERLARKFPNIREFKYSLMNDDENHKSDKIVIPKLLDTILESLRVATEDLSYFPFIREFCLPTHLKKLSLRNLALCRESMSIVGKLPYLEVLNLRNIYFCQGIWEMEEGEFLKLRILKLSPRYLVRWKACDDQFLCLEKLMLYRCYYLEEIPSSLGSIQTLETVEVFRCPQSVENLVRKIEEEQENLGKSGLQVVIRSK